MPEKAKEFLDTILPAGIAAELVLADGNAEIEKGGGTRRFFRARFRGEPAVVCVYDDSKAENALYAGIAGFLARVGVPAPKIFLHDAAARVLVMEDLGDVDLWTLRRGNDPAWRDAYRSALAGAARLHREGLAALGETPIMRDGFDAAYYKWERDYFLTNAAKEAHRLCITGMARVELEHELAGLAARLLALPPQLVHRDFQSQNVLWRDGRARFIDFQGMRVGTGWYDAASLIFDPYVDFSDAERDALFDDYCGFVGVPEAERPEAKKTFFCAAAQRLMQACGAYFFLSTKMGKPRYRAFALPALDRLKRVAEAAGTLPNLAMLATELRSRERRRAALGLV